VGGVVFWGRGGGRGATRHNTTNIPSHHRHHILYATHNTYLLGDEAAGVGLKLVGQVGVRHEHVRVDVVPNHVLFFGGNIQGVVGHGWLCVCVCVCVMNTFV
jgi:hypothetical protein